MKFLESLHATISQAQSLDIPEERKKVLQSLIDFIQDKIDSGEAVHLNFICTHNSRRSQFSQIWAQTAAAFYRIPAYCYSGGVEVTAFNDRAVASIRRSGFRVAQKGVDNPFYFVFYSEDEDPIAAFSKLYDDPINSKDNFAAVMTCAHADENCPFIPGASARIPVRYEDPKAFDDTPEEASRYDERSLQIASEMFYVFANVSVK
ncbi:protein-tyrosine-phosphatase [Algoriphagus vanfongensis]|uniref:protein-tyrosine-phosphatase n=1 Tax=Algoriphagus vanfongensis TaxID=426371 RepID=UPI00041C372A|nr:protein-tyrosine-phosphatase [Algoriphagus vanfongensis]